MTQQWAVPHDIVESFLPSIFENDAKGILSDLLGQPGLAMHFMGFSEAQTLQAIRHVVGILEECYRAGHLKIAISHDDGRLYGYAMFFVHPDPAMPRYLHKIFVFKAFRGHGIGSQLLGVYSTIRKALACCAAMIWFRSTSVRAWSSRGSSRHRLRSKALPSQGTCTQISL